VREPRRTAIGVLAAGTLAPVSEQIGRTVIPGRYEVEHRYDSTRSARLAFEIPGAEGE